MRYLLRRSRCNMAARDVVANHLLQPNRPTRSSSAFSWFTPLEAALGGMLVLFIILPAHAQSVADAEMRTIDGSQNNVTHPDRGQAGAPLLRIAPPTYPDDGSGQTMLGPPYRPNPRQISNAIVNQGGQAAPNKRNLSHFIWQWGQFLDHDISLTPPGPASGAAPIPIYDPADPLAPGPLPFSRSTYAEGTGTGSHNPRQQMNVLTSWIDGSQVYGSDAERAATLRSFSQGELRTGEHDLLPLSPAGHGVIAGDERVNEQVMLTSMHTIFMREHNRLADEISEKNPNLNDEQIYQAARRIVGAEIQKITYEEFLPALMSDDAPRADAYEYDPSIDPRISNSFSTALFRLGHSFLPDQLALKDADGETTETLQLHEAFLSADMLQENPERIDQIMRGLASQPASELDTKIVDGVRNFLIVESGRGGLDLAAFNIQRGRDHGLPDYNTIRDAYGLSPVESFSDITSDIELQRALAEVYGDVDAIDPWIGALAEDQLTDSSLGELLTAAMWDQFTRLRDGDRFFYTDDSLLTDAELRSVIDIESVRLSDVIEWNTSIVGLPDNLFFLNDRGGHVIPAPSAFAAGLLLLGAAVLRRRRRGGLS